MKQVLYFSLGAAVGLYTGYTFCKKKFQKIANEEIESVKKSYEDKYKDIKEFEEKYRDAEREKKRFEAAENVYNKAVELGYVVDSVNIDFGNDISSDTDLIYDDFPREERLDKPYVIGPDVYEEDFHGFDKIVLVYWSGNDILMNEQQEEVDIDYYIGRDNLERFGEYESSTVFVRNERLGADFEVLFEEGEYAEE